jgi:hypothetical protein
MKRPTPPKYNTLAEALAADEAEGYRFIRSKIDPETLFGFLEKPSGKTYLKAYRGTRSARPKCAFNYRSRAEAYAFAKEFAEGQVENRLRALTRQTDRLKLAR